MPARPALALQWDERCATRVVMMIRSRRGKRQNRSVTSSARTSFARFLAIGDSTTEGLEDRDENGEYRGWADRLAVHIARGQSTPLEYANLAIRGLRLGEIRARQFDEALGLEPDLMTIFGGVNDVISSKPSFGAIAADLEAMFSAASERGITVLTFTMPDPSRFNPIGRFYSERMSILNDLIRAAARSAEVMVMDFADYPIAADPRLWFADRLHGNSLGHERVAAALAWRLGIEGSDDSWTRPLPGDVPSERLPRRLATDVDWAVHYLAPWVGKGLRHIPHGQGVSPKRPVPTVVDL